MNHLAYFFAALTFTLMLVLCLASIVYGVVGARVPMATAGLVLPMALSYFSQSVVDYQFGLVSTTIIAGVCAALAASATIGARRRSRL